MKPVDFILIAAAFVAMIPLCAAAYHINIWRRPLIGAAVLMALGGVAFAAIAQEPGWRVLVVYVHPETGQTVSDHRKNLLPTKAECEATASVEIPQYFPDVKRIQWVCVPNAL